MVKTFIFLSKTCLIKPYNTSYIVSIDRQQLLLLKNRGNDNNRLITHISEARINKGLSIAEMCRLTGLSYDNYVKYEREEVKEQYKNLTSLQKISAVLDLDLFDDYLFFKENSKEKVNEYMSINKISIRQFAKLCGVSVTTIKNWRNGTCCPSYENWQKYFKK